MMEEIKANTHSARRVQGKPSERISMVFTRDRNLIAQYRRLRRDLYEIDPRFVGFRMFNDTHAEYYEDPDDQMLILQCGGEVVGGARLRISTPQHPVMLDLENDILPRKGKFYFSLREELPHLQLHKYAFAEFIRIALHPSLRKGVVLRQMFQVVLKRCIEYRVRYMFGIGDHSRRRLYQLMYREQNLKALVPPGLNLEMRPEYEGIEMYLIYTDMKHLFETPEDPEAKILLLPRNDFKFD